MQMKVYVSIDDTDNIDSRGTGELASIIADTIESKGWGTAQGVTRHQLLIHPDIPYTSHNSSMCFEAAIGPEHLEELIDYASFFLKSESAEGSDPGLCVAQLEKIVNRQELLEFGQKAKKVVISKEEAYGVAKSLGVHLSEHGGTGQGIIGALAGIGLRMSGNDGRYKGKIKLDSSDGMLNVKELIQQTGADRVKNIDGDELGSEEMIHVGENIKPVLLDGKATLLVYSEGDEQKDCHELIDCHEPKDGHKWHACSNKQLKAF